MRAFVILLVAMTLGLGAGYAWSSFSAPAAHASAKTRKSMIALPSSPEEQPEALDGEWAARAADHPTAPVSAQGGTTPADTIYYAGCNEVRAAGKAPLHAGQPGYRVEMDGDSDGVACEPYRGGPRS